MSKVLKFDDTYVPIEKISSCTISRDLDFDMGTKIKYTLSIKVDGGMTHNVITGVEDKSLLETFILDKLYGNSDGVISYGETPLTVKEKEIRKEKIARDKEDENKPDKFEEVKQEKVEETPNVEMVAVDSKKNLNKEEIKEIFENAKKKGSKKKGD